MNVPAILCVVGPSGSGKTRLLEALIGRLVGDGLHVGAVKHAGHLHAEAAGKDSQRLAAAGAAPVIAAAPTQAVVEGVAAEPGLLDLVATFCTDCDLVLAEGYSRSAFDKILVCGPDTSGRPAKRIDSVRFTAGPSAADLDAAHAWVGRWLHRRRSRAGDVIGAILTGGQSRRMGRDKSQMLLGGQSVLARTHELLAGRLSEVWIVGRRPCATVGSPNRVSAESARAGEPPVAHGVEPPAARATVGLSNRVSAESARAGKPPVAHGTEAEPLGLADLPRCASWHLDLAPSQGPLGGVVTALRIAAAAGTPRAVLAVACDMPRLEPDVIEWLLEHRDPDAPATAPLNPRTGKVAVRPQNKPLYSDPPAD